MQIREWIKEVKVPLQIDKAELAGTMLSYVNAAV
jgi:hypothetical protein